MKTILLLISHALVGFAGFALGIYLLPIITAPDGPTSDQMSQVLSNAKYQGEFRRDLPDSDFLHWGEGTVSLSASEIVHIGSLAPGPDYKLYLVPEFVEHEDEFLPLKSRSVQVGDVKTFDGLLLEVPDGVDIEAFTTVLIWCEAFGEFITAAKYR